MEDSLIKVLSYFPWFILVVGVIGNLCAFLIFTFNKNMNRMSSMTYLSFISIADTFSLFVWNLDHFFLPNYAFKLENLGVVSCKVLSFIQFTSLQLSGLLHAFISIDRYFTIVLKPGSLKKRLPFGKFQGALSISLTVTALTVLVNFHLLVFNGHWDYDALRRNSTDDFNSARVSKELAVNIVNFLCYYSEYYEIVPTWNRVHMVIYNLVPFSLMAVFNSLLIYKTFYNGVKMPASNLKKSLKRRRLTISLLVITFGFVVMTLPGTIVYGFFYDFFFSFKLGHAFAMISDYLMFIQHSSIFFSCFLTNYKFHSIIALKVSRLKYSLVGNSSSHPSADCYELTTHMASTNNDS